MLYSVVVALYVLVCFLLMVVILLQQGKGGDMAAAFGGGGGSQAVFGARSGATVLTKATTGLAIAFVLGSLLLSVWTQSGPSSVVGGIEPAPAPTAPAQQAPATPATQPPAQPVTPPQ
ncbi:MAG: preprotein translocase subunit SecG [Acidobacteriota bacterium]